MKTLVTGSSGFYGTHLCDELEKNGDEVIRCDLKPDRNTIALDIMNADLVQNIVETYRPDALINMAGQANVGLSWNKPQFTVQLNTIGAINIFEAVRKTDPGIRIITIGSSDEYGNLKEKGSDVTEELPLSPVTPYAISKQAQEEFASLYVRNYGMDICMIRQFNMGGAGQSKGFMISDFASGIAEIELGKRDYLSVGNMSSSRDFMHVKDACRAIRMIADKGRNGEIYNICSGITYKASDILDMLVKMAKTEIKVCLDPARIRPSDTPVIRGNHDKLTEHTGWMPKYNIEDILEDALNYWREKLKD